MLFTPEMDYLLPKLGKKVHKHYKQLTKEFDYINDLTTADPEFLRDTYDLLTSMKSIYVGSKNTSVYKTILSLLQFKIAEGLGDKGLEEAAFKEFRMWSEKLSQFKDRRLWWSHIHQNTLY